MRVTNRLITRASAAAAAVFLMALLAASFASNSTLLVSAQSSISIQKYGNNVSVKVVVSGNVSQGVLIVAVFKVVRTDNGVQVQELTRFNAAYVTSNDVVEENVTSLPPGNYVVKVMLWNDMLMMLSSSKSPWTPLMYAAENVTIA